MNVKCEISNFRNENKDVIRNVTVENASLNGIVKITIADTTVEVSSVDLRDAITACTRLPY